MSDNWKCPHCGAINPKPGYLLRLMQLAQQTGTIRLGKSDAPEPRCSQCGFTADANTILAGEYDYAEESAPERPLKAEKAIAKTLSTPPRSDRIALTVVGGLAVAMLCLGVVFAAGVGVYLHRAMGEETLRSQPTSESAASPRASAITPTPELTVRMLGSAETQSLMERQNIPFLARKAIEQYSAEELNQVGKTLTYTIYLDNSEPLAWGTGWCTTTEAILSQNFEHIQYTFFLNGKKVPIDQFVEAEYYSEELQGFCREYYTVLTDWMPGEHLIKTIVAYDQPINDGWDDYPAGTKTFEYRVIVVH